MTYSKNKPKSSSSVKETLPIEEINILWKTYADNRDDLKTREKLILQFVHLVKYVVSRLIVSLPVSISHDDLVGYGTEGLIEAVDRFDYTKGLKFETYAITRIRGSIIDKLRSQDWVPRGVRKRSKQLQEAVSELEKKLGRQPGQEELAEKLQVTLPKLRQMITESNNLVLSLDDSKGTDNQNSVKMSLGDTIIDSNSPDPLSVYEASELKLNLSKAISSLPEREKMIIILYYRENLTLKEIGKILSVSESRVCQLHAQSVLRLRNKLKSDR